jgi:membrane associated rhomboid family serine protease
MLEDRPYMRGPSFGSHRSVTTLMITALVVCFVVESILRSYSRSGSQFVYEYLVLTHEAITRGQVWQFLTFQFLHAGFLHVFFNCLTLYFFGKALEITLPTRHWLGIYFGGGFAGGLLHALGSIIFPHNFPGGVVGASAGIASLLAAFSYFYPQQEINLWFILRFPAKFFFILAVILSLFFVLVPAAGGGIAHGAHLGGLLFGYAYARWFIHWEWKLPNLNFFRRPKIFVHTRQPSTWPSQKREKLDLPSDEFISQEVDPILDKISAHGIQSLTERERKILEAARAKMARR